MRLTLRTLLAYLDDTLEPTEIKQIGQKVAESDAAQELIARIKQVTRKRRLTTPPLTGPGAKFDPNLIAEYLDNELDGEQVAEIEKVCLESDVHLAEIAACHQILTLVLGEPALVPPTARERMYGLVKGREAIPFRKAAKDKPGGDKPGTDKTTTDKAGGDKPGTDKPGTDKTNTDKTTDPVKPPDRVPAPSKDRKEVATYAPRTGTPSVLVSRPANQE